MSYLSVADVAAPFNAALAAGATSPTPQEGFGPAGRGATLAGPGRADATGAAFPIIKNPQGDRCDSAKTAVGDWHWSELTSGDEQQALIYQEKAFGYEHGSTDMGRWARTTC